MESGFQLQTVVAFEKHHEESEGVEAGNQTDGLVESAVLLKADLLVGLVD